MAKITSYMRVTKRNGPHTDVKAVTPSVSKPRVAAKPAKALAAEEVVDEDGEIYQNGVHVPTFIYATVKYTRKGEPHEVDDKTQRVVAFITKHFDVPTDFETSKKFGPHSGMTYESRLMRAYKLKLLTPLKSTDAAVQEMCITCGSEGHSDRECTDGF